MLVWDTLFLICFKIGDEEKSFKRVVRIFILSLLKANKLECSFLGKHYRPSILFVNKAEPP
jgi:hypothetical protein